MGANVSAAKERTIILTSSLEFFAGCFLIVECPTPECPKGRERPVSTIPGLDAGITVGEMVLKLRCGQCGKKVSRAAFRCLVSRNGERSWAVTELVGKVVPKPSYR